MTPRAVRPTLARACAARLFEARRAENEARRVGDEIEPMAVAFLGYQDWGAAPNYPRGGGLSGSACARA